MEKTIEDHTNLNKMNYQFVNIDKCNMCGHPTDDAKVLGRRLNGTQGKRPKKKVGITTTVMQCKKCQLIFSNPIPIPETLEQHYGVPPETYWTPEYFKVEDNYFKHEIDTFKKLNQLKADKFKSLDIGAGIGKCMIALGKAGFDAYGIEPSKPFYDRAIEKMNLSPDKLQYKAVETAEFSADFFDFITIGVVLEHVYDPSDAVEKAMDWLKPGGLLHIQVPSSHWLTNRIANALYKVQGLDYVANISPMHAPFHLYEFSLESFLRNGEKLNYDVLEHRFYVSDTYLPKILDFVLKPLMNVTDTGMLIEVWLRKK